MHFTSTINTTSVVVNYLYVNFYQTSRQYKSFNFVFRQLINIHRQQRKLKQFNINHEISCKI